MNKVAGNFRRYLLCLWGNGDHGRLGSSSKKSFNIPRLCDLLIDSNVTMVACGGAHTLALTGELMSSVFT